MAKSLPRETPTPNEELRPRHRNGYDYDGEYEFLTAQHWTTPDERARPRDVRFFTRPVGSRE
jgi:hypothetical protein